MDDLLLILARLVQFCEQLRQVTAQLCQDKVPVLNKPTCLHRRSAYIYLLHRHQLPNYSHLYYFVFAHFLFLPTPHQLPTSLLHSLSTYLLFPHTDTNYSRIYLPYPHFAYHYLSLAQFEYPLIATKLSSFVLLYPMV